MIFFSICYCNATAEFWEWPLYIILSYLGVMLNIVNFQFPNIWRQLYIGQLIFNLQLPYKSWRQIEIQTFPCAVFIGDIIRSSPLYNRIDAADRLNSDLDCRHLNKILDSRDPNVGGQSEVACYFQQKNIATWMNGLVPFSPYFVGNNAGSNH